MREVLYPIPRNLLCITLYLLLLAEPLIAMSSRVGNQPVKSVIFHWFRGTDLRLHDNPALHRSAELCAKTSATIVPVFCFDPRIYGDSARSEFGSLKCGPRRAAFVLDGISDLRESLEKKGCRLLVACERPDEFMKKISREMKGYKLKVVYQDEVCSEERAIESEVKKVFNSYEAVWGSTLYNLKDLPYADGLVDLPDTFTPFRNKVEKKCTIQMPLAVPNRLPFPSVEDFPVLKDYVTYIPTLSDLGYTVDQVKDVENTDERGVVKFRGGEKAALARVQDYIWDKDLLKVYFETRNGMLTTEDYSTKFAPWLAHGNLSPRHVARECTKYEEQREANKSTYWVVFELIWRDFFKFFALKHGQTLFFPSGTIGSSKPWKHYQKNLQAWINGKTGFPLVDANMRELAATGFMSNRGRQNVASFLALELNQDWRYGADYFESTLLDYDVHSNWGNWCAAAGMTGGRLNRFNIVKQSKDYDQHGDYVRFWLPELKDVPTQFVHEPWKMNQFQQSQYNCRLGVDYPNPIAKPFSSSANSGGGGTSRSTKDGDGGRKNNSNNRGRGQRKDMKSLKQGTYRMD
jgi:deoxyribodipyrimidine photo-lyase